MVHYVDEEICMHTPQLLSNKKILNIIPIRDVHNDLKFLKYAICSFSPSVNLLNDKNKVFLGFPIKFTFF